jgi:phosphoribosylformylglycinamidine cyclo-ligase
MSSTALTYRSCGVDVGVNEDANTRIAALVRSTYNADVLVDSGLFAGVLQIDEKWKQGPVHLGMSLGFASSQAKTASAIATEILAVSSQKLAKSSETLAFLDYLASDALDANAVASVVEEFCSGLVAEAKPVPLIGGETAEMPGVFKSGWQEVVGTRAYLCHDVADSSTSDLNLSPFLEDFKVPCLVFSADGVGTKASLAHDLGRLDNVVDDLIHHSLGDILCLGARGLGIAIYVGGADLSQVQPALESKIDACVTELGLRAFEVAFHEAPWLYQDQQVDLCATVAGIVDRSLLLTGATIKKGDCLIGLQSSGLHTNGYSLARRALFERGRLNPEQWFDDLGSTLGEALLVPHRNYAPVLAPLLGHPKGSPVLGLAHITGGGIQGNLSRILPPGLGAQVDLASFEIPPIFTLIQESGNIAFSDPCARGMLETFNLGIGMILVVSAKNYAWVMEALDLASEQAYYLGEVVPSNAEEAHERVYCVA